MLGPKGPIRAYTSKGPAPNPDIFQRFFFQAEDGIRDVLGSRGLGDVYKRQSLMYWVLVLCLGYESYVWDISLMSGILVLCLGY